MYYILEGKEVKKIDNLIDWAQFMEKPDRIVEQTEIGEVRVSTVFLGINHQYGSGPPLLFETMIFGGQHDQYQNRYCTWNEAEAGHKKACDLVMSRIN